MDSSETQQGGASDSALSLTSMEDAQYASPDLMPGVGSSSSASGWSCDAREMPPQKRLRAGGPTVEVDDRVDLTPTQLEVLGKVVSKVDTDNGSIVITNPLKQGAREPRCGTRTRSARCAWGGACRRSFFRRGAGAAARAAPAVPQPRPSLPCLLCSPSGFARASC